MLFTSSNFVFFFIIYLLLFFQIPHRFRWLFCLLSSLYFYMCWRPEYVVLIIVSITIDYLAARYIEATDVRWRRKLALIVSLCTNLGLLGVFKYGNFVFENVASLMGGADLLSEEPLFDVLLPVGISFYTFQSMSYTIDVYRRRIRAERHYGYFAAYVSFFPQLVAGPIERASNLLPQLKERVRFDPDLAVSGLRLMLLGFFKKLCIANQLNPVVSAVYDTPQDFGGGMLVLGTLLFAAEIYCDFSGYTDIAIGVARTQGYHFKPNFREPYLATSFRQFWRRWHISLSTWFRDYVYIPLGGSRRSRARVSFNLIVVFAVSGLWHGASWNFVIWGVLHGVYLAVERFVRRVTSTNATLTRWAGARVGKVCLWSLVFGRVCLGWVFFRAQDLPTAWYIVTHSMSISAADFEPILRYPSATLGTSRGNLMFAFFNIGLLAIIDWQRNYPVRFLERMWARPRLRLIAWWALCYIIVFSSIVGHVEFIYFQF